MKLLLLISGPLAVGKSAVAKVLIEEWNFQKVSSGNHLKVLANSRGHGTSRSDLQFLGDSLDEQTDYRWLIDEVAVPAISESPKQERWFIDAVRKPRQVEHFRNKFGKAVSHAHLTVDEVVLEQRYNARLLAGGEYAGNTPYEVAIQHPNEVEARSLIKQADFVVEVEKRTVSEITAEIMGKLATR